MHENNIHKTVFLLTDKSVSKLLEQNISKAYWTGEGSTTRSRYPSFQGKTWENTRKDRLEIMRILNRRKRPTPGKSLFTRKLEGKRGDVSQSMASIITWELK